MAGRFHGVFSLALIGVAVAVAAIALFGLSPWGTLGYLVAGTLGMSGVLYSFCAKCPCKAHCGHVVPGKIAGLFPRRSGPYQRWEIAMMGVGVALILVPPFFWLWQNLPALVIFVLLIGVGVGDITRFVCRACNNNYCPVKSGS